MELMANSTRQSLQYRLSFLIYGPRKSLLSYWLSEEAVWKMPITLLESGWVGRTRFSAQLLRCLALKRTHCGTGNHLKI